MNKTIKIIVLVVLILVALGVLFYFLGNKETPVENKLSSSDSQSIDNDTGDALNADTDTSFLQTLEYLKSMSIDASIFLSTSFKSLKDNTVTIEFDGVVGRENPFSPIAGMQQSQIPLIKEATTGTINTLKPQN